MHALILAAGDGGRLQPLTNATPKPLLKLAGRPIINHVLDALSAAGVDGATIVVGYEGAQIRRALDGLHSSGVSLSFVENEAFDLHNARSIWAARDAVPSGAGFILTMADHLVEPTIYRQIAADADGRCRLAVDFATRGDLRANEATLALVESSRVVDLGKRIPDWNALDTGVFWCTPAIFDAMTPDLRDGEAGAVFARLARAGALDAVDVTGARWTDIDTEVDLNAAEVVLATMRSAGVD